MRINPRIHYRFILSVIMEKPTPETRRDAARHAIALLTGHEGFKPAIFAESYERAELRRSKTSDLFVEVSKT